MTATFVPQRALIAARNDLGLSSGPGRCQEYTAWQTRGQIRCSPFCASALSMWLSEGGYLFKADEHVWGDRGDWNVTTFRQWAQRKGLWRDPRSYHAKPSDGVVMRFTMLDQHIGMVAAHAAPGQPVATIEGNTSGGRVLAKVRSIGNVQGFIAFTESGQLAAEPPKPLEVKQMGQAAACIVPGAHIQTGGVHKGRWPMVDAFQNPDGSWDLRGVNGTRLTSAFEDVHVFNVSVHHLGKLNKPITSIEPVRTKTGDWDAQKAVVAIASDGGTFQVNVKNINYT